MESLVVRYFITRTLAPRFEKYRKFHLILDSSFTGKRKIIISAILSVGSVRGKVGGYKRKGEGERIGE